MGKEDKRKHRCPHCAAAFSQASKRDRHVHTVHEKRKDHVCPHCAAAFSQAGNLTVHVRAVHEKRRDHACQQAGPAGQPRPLRKIIR